MVADRMSQGSTKSWRADARTCAPAPRMRLTAWLTMAAALAGACLDQTGPRDRPPISYEFIVSDTTSPASLAASGAVLSLNTSQTGIAYASLPPGAIPEGELATIRNLNTASTVTVPLNAGGFDPVAVSAAVGDTITVVVRDASGAVVLEASAAVAASRRPVVVRTNPPPRKRDVPLNTSVVVVFSEPIARGTVTRETIRLLRAGQPVNGQPVLVGDALRAEFRPDGLLASGAEYTLQITNGVTDLEGEPLEQALGVTFTTAGAATQAASVTVGPARASLHSDTTFFGARVQLTATVRDSRGDEITTAGVVWASSNPQVARVDATGLVRALTPGTATITATAGGLQGTAVITVLAAIAAMGLQVDGVPLCCGQYVRVEVGQTVRVVATARDAAGSVVTGYKVHWFSDPHLRLSPVSETDADITGLRPGEGQAGAYFYPVTGEAWSGGGVHVTVQTPDRASVASVEVKPETLRTVPQASVHLQAIVRDTSGNEIHFAPVVWSLGGPNLLWGGRSTSLIWSVNVPTSLTVVATAGGRSDTATVVSDYVTLTAASLGINGYECYLTTTGAAYCSGNNYSGQLGIDVAGPGGGPVGVAGGITFASLSTGFDHSCALSTAGAAYCWGSNRAGQLGRSTDVRDCDSFDYPEGDCSNSPVTVSGGRTFTHISAGGNGHTCALTAAGAAYCWGANGAGELGDGTTNGSLTPVAVAGGLTFAQISAGVSHTCGLTAGGAAYCWGNNDVGQLGDGSFTNRFSPAAVAGLTFTEVSAGGTQTCGLTAGGAAYCWGGGDDEAGLLGDGASTTRRSSPMAVALPKGVTLTQIDAGETVTCGLATDGAAYCWGLYVAPDNGDGHLVNEVVLPPTRVPGGLAFRSVSSGFFRSCGVTPDPVVYCWGGVIGSPSPVWGQR